MKNYSRLAVLISTASVLGASAVATPMQGRGMASAMPVGLSLRSDGPVAANAVLDPVRVKAPLNRGTAPATWASLANGPSPVGPDYSATLLHAGNEDITDVDGQSRGADQVPTPDGGGAPQVGTAYNNWLAYVISVRQGALGENGGHIQTVQQAGSATGAELLGFYAERSQQLDTAIPGTTRIEATAISLGYDGTVDNTADVDAIDYGIGVSGYGGANSSSSIIFQASDFYYYTVTNASAWDLNLRTGFAYAFDDNNTLQPANGGDIYVKQWLGTNWGPTEIYMTAADLGLNPGSWGMSNGEDVDALSVTTTTNSDVIVFSTARATSPASRDQLLISIGDGTNDELTDLDVAGNRTSVFDRVDLARETDDIDGICGIDPRDHDHIDRVMGTTITSLAKSPYFAANAAMMDLSFVRSQSPVTLTESLMLQLSGWGNATAQDSDMMLLVYTGTTAIPPNADPFEVDANGNPLYSWVPSGLIPRLMTDDQWELTIPFGIGGSNTYMAVCVALFAKPVNGGALIAGSGVTQIVY